MEKQDWEDKHLDKDLLGGNLYSPETCVFISNEMNSFIKSSQNKYGLPRGVSKSTSGSVYAKIVIAGESVYLGSFDTISEAKHAYNSAKIARAYEIFRDEPLLSTLIERIKCEY